MDIQALIKAISDTAHSERSKYHLTLGGLVAAMEGVDASMPVKIDTGYYPGLEHSYRGYYSDLSFEQDKEEKTVGQFLKQCKSALGSAYEGYKGGDYVMSEGTPLWIAEYGCTGAAMVDFRSDGSEFTLITKVVD